ncbi:hypothetical protein L6164_030148 [Bauhinia variegata]|uniref:Uncharacterized protein n=1 Tax=Bauhinia variegata TaxID=167791 RepID=A0ACB9LBU2_BAUVA|nr:hypothetical protein L6164_030148 [Bauhinia variegata]
MQLLVGQMYNSGYGVPRNPHKGLVWISKASKGRNSVWKASGKHPELVSQIQRNRGIKLIYLDEIFAIFFCVCKYRGYRQSIGLIF